MKTFLMTLVIKTCIGYAFIQEIKRMNDTTGVISPNEPAKELFMAAVFPNPIFLVIGVFSFLLALSLKNAFKKDTKDGEWF